MFPREDSMASTYTVKPGENLSQIAARNGMTAKALYEDPANAKLRAKRPNPNLILPGDPIVIPDKKQPGGQSLMSAVPAPSVYDAAVLALDVYGQSPANTGTPSSGWQVDYFGTGPWGFAATTYKRGKDRTVAYRGTDDGQDGVVDASMVPPVSGVGAFKVVQTLLERYGLSSKSKTSIGAAALLGAVFAMPQVQANVRLWANQAPVSQTQSALDFFDQHGSGAFLVVGHSLGGALAQLVSMWRGVPAVAFNSPFMGDLRGTTPLTSADILCVNSDGDPLSLATKTAGNVAHGRVITVPLPPYQGQIPIRQPIDLTPSWGTLLGVALNPLQGVKKLDTKVEGAIADTTQYALDLGKFLANSALYYHSMANLAQALAKTAAMQAPIQPGFQGL
jgi:pimeloyl-ACP methyl ester carboxylesterase